MRLSIIIPVYNVEKYIRKCLDAVLAQDIPLSEYEIIVVNDGSPDNSAAIVSEYEKNYPNIKHIIQENGGPGKARNTGLDNASGKYIWFVDGDDWIKENCLKTLLEYLDDKDVDFCEIPYVEVMNTQARIISLNNRLFRYTISNIEYICDYAIPYGSCFFIFKRSITTFFNIRFNENIYHEDREFNIRLLAKCNTISFFDDSEGIYFYLINRDGSTMTNKNQSHILKRINSYVYILKENDKIFPYSKKRKDYAYYVQRLMNDIITYSLLPLIADSDILHKQKYYRTLFQENKLSIKPDVYNGKTYWKYKILSIVEKNYKLTGFFLKLFDKVANIRPNR